jgi:nucleotide-binding universal stress UspA family protein
MYSKILVPLDGSELAECVLPHVEATAGGCKVKDVVLVRVVEPFRQPASTEYALRPEEVARMEAQLMAEADSYLKKVQAKIKLDGTRVQSEILRGNPAEAVAEYASKNGVDLIVIATHGRSGVSRWVWGSVSDRILRSACVPVLMIRAPGCVPGI